MATNEWDQFAPVGSAKGSEWDQFKPAGPDQSDAETARLAAHPAPEGPGVLAQLGGGAMHAAQRAAAGVAGAGKFMLGPLAKPFEMANEYATSKGYPLAPTQRQLDEGAQFVKNTGPASTVGQIGADIGMSLLPIGAASKAAMASQLLRKVPLGVAGADVAANAAYSAATAPEDRGTAAMWGGGGAAAGRVLSRTLGGLVKPTDDAVELIRQGVRLTPGQASGKGSMVNTIEQWATSNPVSAYPINAARGRAVEDANLLAAQSVVKYVDDKIKLGRPPAEAIELVRDTISATYDDVLPRMRWPLDNVQSLAHHIVNSAPDQHALVGSKQQQALSNYFGRRVGELGSEFDTVPGEFLKQVDSELGSYARQLAKSGSAEERVASPMWYEAQRQWREYALQEAAEKGSNDYARLGKANAAYRELLALEKALRTSGGETIKPRALAKTLQAAGIKEGDLATLSRQMDSTLPGTVPDSGTAQRLMVNALPALVAGGGAAAGLPMLAAGGVAAAALGTRTGTKAMTGQLAPQRALVEAVMKSHGLSKEAAEAVIQQYMAQAGRIAGEQAQPQGR